MNVAGNEILSLSMSTNVSWSQPAGLQSSWNICLVVPALCYSADSAICLQTKDAAWWLPLDKVFFFCVVATDDYRDPTEVQEV